jgi:hypothetical protein
MIRFVVAVIVVFAILYGSLFALRRMRVPVPPQDVIDRVKSREREIEAKEQAEKED